MDWNKIGLLGDALTGFGAGFNQGGWSSGFQGANQSLNAGMAAEKARQEKLMQEHQFNTWLSTQPAQMQQLYRVMGPQAATQAYHQQMMKDPPKQSMEEQAFASWQQRNPGGTYSQWQGQLAAAKRAAESPKGPETKIVDGRLLQYDPQTRKWGDVTPGGMAKGMDPNKEFWTGPDGVTNFTPKGALSAHKDFRAEVKPIVEEAVQIQDSASKVTQSLGKRTGTSDLAAINSYQRLIDPAVVRGEDVALIRSAASVYDQAKSWAAKAEKGELLPEPIRQNMMEMTKALYEASMPRRMNRLEGYRDIVSGHKGLSFDNVVPKRVWDSLNTSPNFVLSGRALGGVPAPPPGYTVR